MIRLQIVPELNQKAVIAMATHKLSRRHVSDSALLELSLMEVTQHNAVHLRRTY